MFFFSFLIYSFYIDITDITIKLTLVMSVFFLGGSVILEQEVLNIK